jgi:hypothetical protein
MRPASLSPHERKAAIDAVASLAEALNKVLGDSKPRGARGGFRVNRARTGAAVGGPNPTAASAPVDAPAAATAAAPAPAVAAAPRPDLSVVVADENRAKRPREGLVDPRLPALPYAPRS